MRRETRQVGAGGVDGVVIHAVGKSGVRVQVEGPPIPIGVAKDHVFKIIAGRGKWFRAARDGAPSQFAARLESWGELFAGARIHSWSVDLSRRFHLRMRQALRAVTLFAFERSGVKTAAGRIANDAILQPVLFVAGCDSGLVD